MFYDATRKLVLRGADAVVFVADSQAQALDGNKESFQNLIDNLKEQGSELEKLPHVIQFNKRDTPNALPVDVLDREINRFGAPTFEACATQGTGRAGDPQGRGPAGAPAPDREIRRRRRPSRPPRRCSPGRPARPGRPDAARGHGTGPLEVEDLGAGEMLEEIEELPGDPGRGPAGGGRRPRQQRGGSAGGAGPEPVQRRLPGGDPIEALPQIGHIGQTRDRQFWFPRS